MDKEKLQTYRELERERLQIERELQKIETQLYSPKAQQLTGMPFGPPQKGGGLEAAVAKHIDRLEKLRKHYATLLDRLVAAQLEIERAIEAMDPDARTLLRYRYIDGLKWEEICVKMNYSWRSVHRLHAAALIRLKEGEKHGN